MFAEYLKKRRNRKQILAAINSGTPIVANFKEVTFDVSASSQIVCIQSCDLSFDPKLTISIRSATPKEKK